MELLEPVIVARVLCQYFLDEVSLLNSSTYCALNSDCYPCNPMRSPYESEYCRGSRRKPEKCTDRDILNGRRGCYPIYSYP